MWRQAIVESISFLIGIYIRAAELPGYPKSELYFYSGAISYFYHVRINYPPAILNFLNVNLFDIRKFNQ